MDPRSKGTSARAADAVQQLLVDLEKNGHSNGSGLANLRSLHQERQQTPTRASTSRPQQPQPRAHPSSESTSAAQLRIAHEEAKARRLAAEADKARAEAALKSYRASPPSKQSPKLTSNVKSKAPSGTSTPHALSPADRRPKPSKMTSLMHVLFTGLNVQARTWEAPTGDLVALQQARRSIGDYQFNQQRKTKEMAALLNEVRANGGNEADAIQVLHDLVDRKINKEEAEKRMEALKTDKKKDDKGLSIAEKEELARLEIRAQQLKIQKLQLQRREQERKEVEEIQKKIRDLGLPVRLSKPSAHPYEDYYSRGRQRDPMAFAGFDDDEMGLHSSSPAFGQHDDQMYGSEDDFEAEMRALPQPANPYAQPRHPLQESEPDDEAMLSAVVDPRRRQIGRSASAHPLQIKPGQPAYETLGNTGLPKFNTAARPSAPAPRRAQTTPGAVNFRLQPNDPRLDPRSAYYSVKYAQAFRQQQQRDAQQLQLAKQAEQERARKLELEKKAMEEEMEQGLIDAQIYQERKLQEEARLRAAQQARDQELARKRNELDHVRSLEEIREHEEQINYLEELLTRHPNAVIPGLDIGSLETDPNALKYVLELVEENIRKPEMVRQSARLLQQALQGEREAAKRQHDIARQEAELNRLEALLTQHPQATIKGIDMSLIQSDPNVLARALQQVEECIRRGEIPIEIPLRTNIGERLNEAKTTRQLSVEEQRLADKFLTASPTLQLTHLKSLPTAMARQRFLDTAMLRADLAQAQDLVQRYRPHGFSLEVPPDAVNRVRNPRPGPVPNVPVIIVEQVRSPPPTQDTGPSFPFPDMTAGNMRPASSSAWKGKERRVSPTETGASSSPTYIAIPTASLPHLPSPPMNTPGRTSVAHPSAAAATAARAAEIERRKTQEAALARQKAYDEEMAEEEEEAELAAAEAEIERERREIVEADEALRQAEQAKAIQEELRRTQEQTQAVLDRQDEARARAEAELEEAAQIQARQMAEAEAAEHAAWGSPPAPPADFVAESPIVKDLTSPPLQAAGDADPWGSPVIETTEDLPNIENDPAWREATVQVNAALETPKSMKGMSPALSKLDTPKSRISSARSSPKAPSNAPDAEWTMPPDEPAPVAPAAEAWSPSPAFATTPKLRSAYASRMGSPASSLRAESLKAASVRSPSVKASSPVGIAVKSPSAKAVSPAASSLKLSTPIIAEEPSSPAPSVRSAKSANPALVGNSATASPVGSEKANSPLSAKASTPLPSAHSTPKAAFSATPKIATPSFRNDATPLYSPPTAASPTRTATPKVATPVTPKAATPKAATPAASVVGWSSPLTKVASPAKTATPKAPSAWGSPAASAKAASSVKPSPAPAAADAWGSPSVKGTPNKAASVHSNQGVDAWGGTASPAKTATPSVKAPPSAGAWGSPAAASAASPARSAASKASKASTYKAYPTSPAFGTTPRIPADSGDSINTVVDNAYAASELPLVSTSIHGVDPVVVSRAESPTPWVEDVAAPPTEVPTAKTPVKSPMKTPVKSPVKTPVPVAAVSPAAALPDHEEPDENGLYPGEEYCDYSDEGDEGDHDEEGHAEDGFDPADFPVYMAGEPVPAGWSVVMNPPPHTFQEHYPKNSPAVTEEAVLNHMAGLAHAYGYQAIYQCTCEEMEDAIIIQGYMVHLAPQSAPLSTAGGPFDMPEKNAGKATQVSDGSTPGWG